MNAKHPIPMSPSASRSLSLPREPLATQLRALIETDGLHPLFQPILALESPRVLGFEALIRGPEGSALHRPDQLFEVARRSGQLAALEFASRAVSCRRFVELELPGLLFLNMSPMSFTDDQYRDGVTREILANVGLSPERVVFELTERHPLDELTALTEATEHFRLQGFAVALDDLGAGYSGLRVWSQLRPDYVKIDRHFIAGIDLDPIKREFVRAMVEIARRTGNRVIAEGIERREELATLAKLGVEFAQGFYLARPQAAPSVSVPRVLSRDGGSRPRHYDSFTQTVGEITQQASSVPPQMKAMEVVERFRADPALTCLPVVDGEQPLGMVSRSDLLNVFSHRYSYELHAQKPIERFICERSMVVEADCELKDAGQRLTEDPLQNLSVDLLVSRAGAYLGVAPIRRLLRCITEEKLRLARHSNPLSQLPGNVPLYEWIDCLLRQRLVFTIAYCDINHFKPFNDRFGYSCGDEVILALAELLTQEVDAQLDFVGHVGGDDFILVLRSPDWRERCERILSGFSLCAAQFLPDGQAGYDSEDREGRRRRYGPLTLSIGTVRPDVDRCKTHHQVSQLLADAKHSAKAVGGSSLFESRRRYPN